MKNKKELIFCLAFLFISSIYAERGTVELASGNLKVVVFEKTGNFCLYCLSTKGKNTYMPLYDDRSLARCNKFFVYYNKKIYELKKRVENPIKIEKSDNAINIIFEYKDKFYVVQKLSFTNQTYGTSGPLLKIETSIENISGERAVLGLKALIDTRLGENRRIPIYTDLRTGIFAETIVEPKFEKDSAIISANSLAACMFLIKHTEVTPFENIYIANWERLQTLSWIPPIVQGRSFSTKYLHNDSALLFVWETKPVENQEKLPMTMLIGYFDYVRRNEPEKSQKPVAVENTLTEQEKLDYESIKALLDKIAEVESDPDKVTDDYIYDLTNQAIDAIDNNKDK